jgi:hypothetical protein
MSATKKQKLRVYNPAGDAQYELEIQASKCLETYPTALEVTAPSFKLTSGASVVTNVASAILTNASSLTSEISNRVDADTALGVRIDEEESARISADGTASTARSAIQSGLNSEITRASAAENINTSAITTEQNARIAGDDALDARIDGEVATSVANEATTRLDADNLEITTRSNADTNLQSQVDNEKSRIDAIMNMSAESLNSFNEIVSAYTGADSSLQTLINNVTNDLAQLRSDFDIHFANSD